jgi:hypothetical protein
VITTSSCTIFSTAPLLGLPWIDPKQAKSPQYQIISSI